MSCVGSISAGAKGFQKVRDRLSHRATRGKIEAASFCNPHSRIVQLFIQRRDTGSETGASLVVAVEIVQDRIAPSGFRRSSAQHRNKRDEMRGERRGIRAVPGAPMMMSSG